MKQIISAIVLTLAIAMTVAAVEAGPYRWAVNQQNTYGWQLMTPEERTEHQTKMRSFTEYESCKTYIAEHHKKMEDRAKEKGVAAPVARRSPCDIMKAKGILK